MMTKLLITLIVVVVLLGGSGYPQAQAQDCTTALNDAQILLTLAQAKFQANDMAAGKALVNGAVALLGPCADSIGCSTPPDAVTLLEQVAAVTEASSANAFVSGALALLSACSSASTPPPQATPEATEAFIPEADATEYPTEEADDSYLEVATLVEVIMDTRGVTGIEFTARNQLVWGDNDGYIHVWDIAVNREVLSVIIPSEEYVFSLAVDPTGRYVATGPYGQDFIQILDIDTGTFTPLEGEISSVPGLAWSPDGGLIAGGDMNGQVHIWSADGPELIEPLTDHHDWVRTVAFSPNGELLVTGAMDQTLYAYRLNNLLGGPYATMVGHEGRVWALAISPDSRWIASVSQDKTVRIWDAETGRLVRTIPLPNDAAGSEVAFSPDGRYLAFGSYSPGIWLWTAQGDPASWYEVFDFGKFGQRIDGIAFSLDGQYVAFGGESSSTVRLWRLR